MSRFYLRLILIPTVLFTALLLIIRAQPYDDHELRQLLLPEGCPAPCFMGIRPGVTTKQEAIQILKVSEWVKNTDNQSFGNDLEVIYLDWNNQKPKWIIDNVRGELTLNNNIVTSIAIYTTFSLGKARILLGLPDMEAVDRGFIDLSNNKQIITYYARYDKVGILIGTSDYCGVDKLKLLPKTIKIIFTAPVKSEFIYFIPLNKISQACYS